MTGLPVEQEEASVAGVSRIVMGCVLVAFLPLLFWHVGGLLERPHYQFLLLLPVALWLLASDLPWTMFGPTSARVAGIAAVLLCCSLAGLFTSAFLWAPWLAAVSFLSALLAVGLFCYGWPGSRAFLPLWVFLWILIPLPLGMDVDLIVYLRSFTTRASSAVLDHFGVLHYGYANVIELPGKPLFIADACSGIHSLYVLMAAALFIVCWLRRSLPHATSLLVSTFGIVLAENVARIVLVALLWGRGHDFSAGTRHEVLGIVLFVCSLILILSLDQLLLFFFPPGAPRLSERLRKLQLMGRADAGAVTPPRPAPAGPALANAFRWLCLIFPVSLLVQFLNLPKEIPDMLAIVDDSFELPELGEDALPQELAGFERTAFSTVERVPGDPFGRASQQWTYARGQIECLVSLDYPYSAAHDLSTCYANIGWKVRSREVLPAAAVSPAEDIGFVQLHRPLFGEASLLFHQSDFVDHNFAIFREDVIGDVSTRGFRRLQGIMEDADRSEMQQPAGETLLQLQIFASSTDTLSADEREDLIALFQSAKQHLKPRIQQALNIRGDRKAAESKVTALTSRVGAVE